MGNLTGATEGEHPVVVVAIEPRIYACAIGATVGDLRPCLDVRVVEPDDLIAEAPRLDPCLVLCSQPRGKISHEADPTWVEFYPYAEPPKVTVHADGQRSTLEDMDLDDLLRIVDSRGGWPMLREGDIGVNRDADGAHEPQCHIQRRQGEQER